MSRGNRPQSPRIAIGQVQSVPTAYGNVDFTNIWIEQYHIISKLGSGGAATVWLAEECDSNRVLLRKVAIKIFIGESTALQTQFESFRADLRILAQIGPNQAIIQYYNHLIVELRIDEHNIPHTESGLQPRDPKSSKSVTAFLIIMEFADGGPLDIRYRQEVVLQQNSVAVFGHFIDVCSALEAAHSQGIVHRDIKPSNLLWFKKQGLVKIGDFGLAKRLNDPSAAISFTVAGSRAYMAPECFNLGTAIMPGRDIYALGCTFYEVLTGELPIDLNNLPRGIDPNLPQDEVHRLIHERAPRPDAVTKAPNRVSIEFSAVISKMMSVHSGQRPTLKEVGKALENEQRRTLNLKPSITDFESVKVPDKPIYRSSYDVDPTFRFEQLKESLFFVFFNTPVRALYKYKTLFGLLDAFFEDRYSVCEVFGKYEWILRFWAPQDGALVNSFCQQVVDRLLDNRTDTFRVLPCEAVEYLGASRGYRQARPSIIDSLMKLHDAQKDDAKGAEKWLKNEGIYVRKTKTAITSKRVNCFSLIKNTGDGSKHERESKMALIVSGLQRSPVIEHASSLAIHRRAYQNVTNYHTEQCDYLISYVVDNFYDAVKVPGLILGKIDGHAFETTTLLASGRYFIYSDRVRLTA